MSLGAAEYAHDGSAAMDLDVAVSLCHVSSFPERHALPLGGDRRCRGCVVSLTDCDHTVFLEKFTPSVFIDSSDAVNLCVVLAFSPQLLRSVLFNFPVLILNMLLACPSSCRWNVPFRSVILSGGSLCRCSARFPVVWRDTPPWGVPPHGLEFSSSCYVNLPLL